MNEEGIMYPKSIMYPKNFHKIILCSYEGPLTGLLVKEFHATITSSNINSKRAKTSWPTTRLGSWQAIWKGVITVTPFHWSWDTHLPQRL